MIRLKIDVLRAQKALEEDRKITYRTMATETGLSYQTVSRLVTGQNETVAIRTLDALCKYFSVGVGELLEYLPDAARSEAA